jgi:hypothetical protein
LLARVGNYYSGAEQYSGHQALKKKRKKNDPQNGQQMVAIVTFAPYNSSTQLASVLRCKKANGMVFYLLVAQEYIRLVSILNI